MNNNPGLPGEADPSGPTWPWTKPFYSLFAADDGSDTGQESGDVAVHPETAPLAEDAAVDRDQNHVPNQASDPQVAKSGEDHPTRRKASSAGRAGQAPG